METNNDWTRWRKNDSTISHITSPTISMRWDVKDAGKIGADDPIVRFSSEMGGWENEGKELWATRKLTERIRTEELKTWHGGMRSSILWILQEDKTNTTTNIMEREIGESHQWHQWSSCKPSQGEANEKKEGGGKWEGGKFVPHWTSAAQCPVHCAAIFIYSYSSSHNIQLLISEVSSFATEKWFNLFCTCALCLRDYK